MACAQFLQTVGDICKYQEYEWHQQAIRFCRAQWLRMCILPDESDSVYSPNVALSCKCIERIVAENKGVYNERLLDRMLALWGEQANKFAAVTSSELQDMAPAGKLQ